MCGPTVIILKRIVPEHLDQYHGTDRSTTTQWAAESDFNKLNQRKYTSIFEFTNLWRDSAGDAEFEVGRLSFIAKQGQLEAHPEQIDGQAEHGGSARLID